MKVSLVLNNRTVKCLIENLGEERVTVTDYDSDLKKVVFEINSWCDALMLIHAGQDSGVELALYGQEGKPAEVAA